MKHMKLSILFSFLALTVTSCGYRLSELVDGDLYNSPIFEKNFYSYHESKFNSSSQGQDVDFDEPTDVEVITDYKDMNRIDPYMLQKYNYDVYQYGENLNMFNIDSSFKYGYISKLFDGHIVCEGRYQIARVQFDEKGFSNKFLKESSNSKPLDYFACSLRVTTDNPNPCYASTTETTPKKHSDEELHHDSTIKLTVSIFCKNDKEEIVENKFSSTLDFNNGNTNRGTPYTFGQNYKFFAFNLKKFNLTRVIGIGFSYKANDDLYEYNKKNGIDMHHSVMLYEVFMPYSEWN